MGVFRRRVGEGGVAKGEGRSGGSLGPAQLLAVGGMLFSMFFGAGNLILPPLLGLQAGEAAVPAMAGFLAAGIGLPVLGIVAAAACGGAHELAGRVGPRFASAFVALVYLTIGPLLAIPRTSSTAFEMLRPLLPATDATGLGVAAVAFSVVFFGVAFALALRPGLLSRVLGRFSAPILIALIVLVVAASVLDGAPAPMQPRAPYDEGPASHGFLAGYQTMDLLAALCFGIVVAANVRELGVSDPRRVAGSISGAGLVAGALMAAIYCGLAFAGMAMGSSMPDATNGASILAASASLHFGAAGAIIVAAIFLLACLNVCTGLISCCSEYFSEAFPRIPLPAWAAVFAAFSCGVSLAGLDAILAFSSPLLGALYPPAIVLVAMGLVHALCDRLRRMWPAAVLTTAVCSVCVALRDALAPGLWLPLDALPFADAGLGWLLPAAAGAVVGAAWSFAERRRLGKKA
ncbi:branched-chain amino acid transport system II carrier protein [Gordonibacter sp. An230]|uniref:branched-chain amino acid transport system II carrier protein n=1 Tax=Gordonibacter sp. An230 TaxID=1965592 RepID=UPI000B39D470|nr:branched-chain amino acid transport system II carrier protein [Gordonibacter sp. An230]OUO89397.1 branched-chain amino acid transport system II carrier protein [Gordonibacter sp. An230]